MSSPTTSSDDAIGWGRCLAACLGALGISALLLFALMLLVDPYDSGHFGWLGIEGVDDTDTHTAAASRARDAQFDSAVIGNSTAQLLNPGELSRATGMRFVQLYVVGASPREERVVLDFFLRHHPRVGALVFVTDPSWCAHNLAEPPPGPFPYWLYGGSSSAYAVRLLSRQAVEHAFQRLAIGLDLRKRNNPDGFFSYEDIWPPGSFHEVNLPRDPAPAATAAGRDIFPEISLLDDAIKKLPVDLPVVLVVPPTLDTTVAKPGTVAADEREACNAALRRIVAGRPHSNFINYRIDNALTRDPANFADYIHYRPIIAARMEQGIAASIQLGEAAKINF
jgi:hypothetical protein